ncbi:MAG: DUF5615 family PIN-like protein [candidate division NC10 bacterium]|nr:DUF5615 family PIN-like protein [candidate division NC10 bacterium]MDE2321946.1 DUF5615 family PIN-like protein [candidate division NC10 bacterium]
MSEGRILVTNDKDFSDLVFRSGQAHQGVVLFRLHDESPATRVRVVEPPAATCPSIGRSFHRRHRSRRAHPAYQRAAVTTLSYPPAHFQFHSPPFISSALPAAASGSSKS